MGNVPLYLTTFMADYDHHTKQCPPVVSHITQRSSVALPALCRHFHGRTRQSGRNIFVRPVMDGMKTPAWVVRRVLRALLWERFSSQTTGFRVGKHPRGSGFFFVFS